MLLHGYKFNKNSKALKKLHPADLKCFYATLGCESGLVYIDFKKEKLPFYLSKALKVIQARAADAPVERVTFDGFIDHWFEIIDLASDKRKDNLVPLGGTADINWDGKVSELMDVDDPDEPVPTVEGAQTPFTMSMSPDFAAVLAGLNFDEEGAMDAVLGKKG